MTKKERIRKALLAARAIAALAETEERDFTPDERVKVAGYLAEAKTLKDEIKEAEGDAALIASIKGFEAEMDSNPEQDPVAAALKGTVGMRFVTSPAFLDWMKSIAPSGSVSRQAKGLISPAVEFKNLFAKDLVTGSDDESAGAFVQTDYTGIYEPLGRYPLNVVGLVNRRTTTSDLIEFVRQTVRVQEAASVPEANVTEYSGATGEVSGEKPEATIEFEQVTTPVKTLAVWIPATKRALSDASQIR
ncbi:unnamed protein product, partial [marine sediment metagenome]